ncbi:hypothetical protein NQK81_22190 [Amycolatopsis roodepoortensis]|uniref:hypothetical protein n=1 Tax=Amycolatopsis roodepoortensis TaxID=700274 RepID=UPI00214C599A|nr:hypothetical protein [Amycolatopsis roodepoortensis]UUV36032.1 hypothetical protein NQK81_22190 [Amycolatopsis roodepoortensis]
MIEPAFGRSTSDGPPGEMTWDGLIGSILGGSGSGDLPGEVDLVGGGLLNGLV